MDATRARNRTLLYLCSAMALALTLAFFAQRLARAEEDQRLATAFATEARERGLAVGHAYERIHAELEGLVDIFGTTGSIDRQSFEVLARGILAREPAIVGLGFAPSILAEERRAFVQRALDEGLDGYRIFERDADGAVRRADMRPRWTPLLYVAPASLAADQAGFDLASDPGRAAGLRLATEHGTAWMLARTGGVGRPRLEVVLPFLHAQAGAAPGTRFLWVQLQEDQLLDRALMDLEPDRLLVRLVPLLDEGEGPSLVIHGRTAWEAGYPARSFEASLAEHFDFTVFGSELRVRVSPGPGFLAAHYSVWPDLAFVGVSVLCLLAIAALRLLFERTRRVEELASRRHLELQEHRYELERQLAAHELVEARSMRKKFVLKDFLGRMGHELRLPMSNLLGYAEMLQDDDLGSEDRQQLVDVLQRNGRHVLSLLGDLIDLARLEAGDPMILCSPCMPRPILREVGTYQNLRALAKGVDLDLGLGKGLPTTILSDAERLRQILMNLIGVAVDLAETGCVRVRVGFEARRGLILVVETDDRGFDSRTFAVVLADWHRADDRLVEQLGGATLSLALCGRLVAVLGGRIDVVSAGEGRCRFVAELPLTPLVADRNLVQPDDDNGETEWSAPAEVDPQALRGRRILVAEDAPDSQRLVQRLLEKGGARVDCADDGQHALDVLRQDGRRYALVVLDLHMPRVDGIAVIRTLRAEGFDRPVLVLTAYADRDEERRCFEAGCDAYLLKPVDSRRLLQEAAALLHRSRA